RFGERLVDVFLAPATLQRADGGADGLLVGLDSTGKIAGKLDQQLRRRLSVGKCAVVRLDLDREEPSQVAQLQVRARIGPASEKKGVQVTTGLNVPATAEGGVHKPDVEPDVVPDE